MILVGLTGGIGAGKSVCATLFSLLGVPVYSSDQRAKYLMSTDVVLIRAILKIFGPESYDVRARLNREHLAKIIFNNPRKLKKMNSIVHPAVREDFEQWCAAQYGEPYVIQESALLFEIGAHKRFHQTILVTAPIEMRIKRVMERDNVLRESVLARISKQMPEEDKLAQCDKVIQNDGAHSLIRQVIEIHKELLSLDSETTA